MRRTFSADEVWRGTVLALAIFVVLASGSMVRSAEGMPLGWQRDVTLPVASAIDRVANFFSLNRPYDWAAGRLGIDGPDRDFEFPEAPAEPEVVAPTATTTTLPPVRVPSAAEPWHVVVAGDSTAKSLGEALQAETVDRPELRIDVKGEISTGLARSDYFNWGARLSEIIESDDPEVILFMVGANDGQAIIDGDGTVVAGFDDPAWEAEYRRRIAGIMDLARGGARRMIWVGEPNVDTGNVQRAIDLGNRIAREEAERREWVSFFDVAALVAGPDGGYSELFTLPGGSTVRCYQSDGVHLSVQCLSHVMDSLVPALTGLHAPSGAAPSTAPVSRSGP